MQLRRLSSSFLPIFLRRHSRHSICERIGPETWPYKDETDGKDSFCLNIVDCTLAIESLMKVEGGGGSEAEIDQQIFF
jgi:hypothetical protein